jgi:hypothetical protein
VGARGQHDPDARRGRLRPGRAHRPRRPNRGVPRRARQGRGPGPGARAGADLRDGAPTNGATSRHGHRPARPPRSSTCPAAGRPTAGSATAGWLSRR